VIRQRLFKSGIKGKAKHGLIFKLGLVYQSMIVCSICKVISNGIEEFEKHLIGQHGLLDSPTKIVHYIAYLEQRITVLED